MGKVRSKLRRVAPFFLRIPASCDPIRTTEPLLVNRRKFRQDRLLGEGIKHHADQKIIAAC